MAETKSTPSPQEQANQKLKDFLSNCKRRDGGNFKIASIQSDAQSNISAIKGTVDIEGEKGKSQTIPAFWNINGSCQMNTIIKTAQGNMPVPMRNLDLITEQSLDEFKKSIK